MTWTSCNLIFSNVKIISNSIHLGFFVCFFHRKVVLKTRNLQFLTPLCTTLLNNHQLSELMWNLNFKSSVPLHWYSRCSEQIEFCNEAVTYILVIFDPNLCTFPLLPSNLYRGFFIIFIFYYSKNYEYKYMDSF